MKIDVKLFRTTKKENVKAIASITVDDVIAVRSIRVMNGSKGLFVSFPSQKKKDGTYEDVVFPVTKEARDEITSAILAKYQETEPAAKEENDFAPADNEIPDDWK